MCGYPAQSGEAREATAADVKGSTGRSDSVRCLNPWDAQSIRQFDANGCWPSLQANSNGGQNRSGVCYALDSMSSNSMKSSNPHSGFHEETITKTLDTNPDPTCNQGGNVIVQPAAFMGGQGAKARSIAYCKDGTTPTLKSAPSGGNTVPDVVYPINTMVATRGGKDDMRTCFGVGEPNDPQFTISAAHEHAVCYPNVARSLTARHDSSPCVDRGQNFICVQNTGRGWWNEGEVAETLRTPCGGDSTKANLVVAVDCRNMCANEELSATIQAKNGGGHSLNYINPVCYRQDGFAGYSEGVGTLKASGGDMGWGTESIVVERV